LSSSRSGIVLASLVEVVEAFTIVLAVGTFQGWRPALLLLWPASLGALAACLLVVLIGAVVHRPLARVPENTLKFGVGVMLTASACSGLERASASIGQEPISPSSLSSCCSSQPAWRLWRRSAAPSQRLRHDRVA
jgi:uncharacterized membrane protein